MYSCGHGSVRRKVGVKFEGGGFEGWIQVVRRKEEVVRMVLMTLELN